MLVYSLINYLCEKNLALLPPLALMCVCCDSCVSRISILMAHSCFPAPSFVHLSSSQVVLMSVLGRGFETRLAAQCGLAARGKCTLVALTELDAILGFLR